MEKQEFDAMVKEMHKQGLSDDDIMGVLYETFVRHQCSQEDYEIMVNWLGYELTDEFFENHGLKRKIK